MTQAKHTPGPWKFSTEPRPNGCPIVGARGLMIAMLAHSIHEQDQCETAIANAQLIAAAPELLAALTTLVPMFAEWHTGFPEHIGDKESPALRQARAAIAKATGSAA